ncbi:hypothetical protein LNO20_17155 [Klebsiella quasipneumoniae subsp. quasipneumoniae]|nr:hypothetical protein [Klebsiella quasipneumoniae subsp. quasipneumoniae]
MDNKETLFLIQNITHQAINPMSGVIGALDNLIDGVVPEHKREQRLRRARSQLEYTVSLIRNLSYFAEYASGNTASISHSSIKTTVIPQAIIESAQFFQDQGQHDHIKIELENRTIQNCVSGDPNLLKQVFMNLIDNGVKYGKPGSILVIKTTYKRKPMILLLPLRVTASLFLMMKIYLRLDIGLKVQNKEHHLVQAWDSTYVN